MSEHQIEILLQVLTAKSGLEFQEIVDSYTGGNNYLKVHKDNLNQNYTCGSNPHFAAKIVD